MMKFLSLALGFVVVGSAFGQTSDLMLSSNRKAGMGGAGLALPVDQILSGRQNPALYASLAKKFSIAMPELGYRLDGLTYNQLRDLLKTASSGGVDSTTARTLAQKYSNGRKEFGALAGLGLNVGGIVISADGGADVTSVPDPTLAAWSTAGATGNPPATSQLDAYGFGYYGLNFGTGKTFSGQMPVDFGVQARVLHSYYSHYVANQNTIVNSTPAIPGPEMGGNTKLDAKGVGFDLGFLGHLKDNKSFVGLTVQNLIEPKVGFDQALPNYTANPSTTQSFNAFKRQVGVGYATTTKEGTAALDIVDIGNHAGNLAWRLGGEVQLAKGFAIRAGYDTRYKATLGFGFMGINIAFSKQNPLSFTTGLKF